MNFEEGPIPGIRGSVTDRNYGFLLLLNGKALNNKGHYGAKSELEQWDLSDIRKIHIIRGPGSVVYGPGAVAGVIEIVTKNAKTFKGIMAKLISGPTHRNNGLALSYGVEKEKYNIFAHAGVTRSRGYTPRQFLGSKKNQPGFVGEDIQLDDVPLDYFSDYQDRPQAKFYVESEIGKNWNLWARYSQQGSTWHNNEVKTLFEGANINQQGVSDRQISVVAEHRTILKKGNTLTSVFGITSSDVERRRDILREESDKDHPLNFKTNFSEREVFLRTVWDRDFSKSFELVVGFEYANDHYGPGWGDDPADMRLGGDGIILSDENSLSFGGKDLGPGEVVFAGDGWTTNTYSLFGEVNYSINSNNRILLSARGDKSTFGNFLFSPRLAYVHKVVEGHFLKLNLQKSIRSDTEAQLFIQQKLNNSPTTEELRAVEAIYTGKIKQNLSLDVNTFYNDKDVLAWNNKLNKVEKIGRLKLFGIETELLLRGTTYKFGASYSFVKQIKGELGEGINSSGISYSDYNQGLQGTPQTQMGEGNDLNNWPNQSLKLFTRYKINDKWTVHLDTRVAWDYQGSKDRLISLKNAVAGTSDEDDVNNSLERIESEDVYEYDFRANASVSYNLSDKLNAQLFVYNIFETHGNKRYSYDTGNNSVSPKKLRFVEEKRAYEMRLSYSF